MPKIIWTDDFNVGHPEIDAQHKKWVDIFNTAHDQIMSGDSKILSTMGIDAVNAMMEYAATHFEFEEKYMEEMGYPDIKNHREAHHFFSLQLKRINDDFLNGNKLLNSEVIKIISNWLVDHILNMDQKYKEYNEAKG